MSAAISVITPSLPTRTSMLAQACASVAAQTLRPVEHLVGVDYQRDGSAHVRNRLASVATGTWLAFLDDDDLLHAHHLATLAQHSDDADLVYSRPDGYDPTRPFDPDALRAGNFIPVTVLVRASAFRAAGGFPDDAPNGWEDWACWLELLDAGARFRFVDRVTWTYRLHDGSKTFATNNAH